jgi:hypothetical protein
MYLLCFAFFSSAILTGCVSQEEAEIEIDFSQAVSPIVYQEIVKQGFSTNYFKSKIPARDYKAKHIDDIFAKGFRNVRLRVRADLYEPPYNNKRFTTFLNKLEAVVDKCLEVGVAPIISWIHHLAEAYATEEDRQNYLNWWRKVAKRLKFKNYRLSFNLFTELGVDYCKTHNFLCSNSLRKNTEKYNDWTAAVVRAIRNTGANNAKRILILASPKKDSSGLSDIDKSIYRSSDHYMMVEWHLYAAGPYKRPDDPRYWSGNGTIKQRQTLRDQLQQAREFTTRTGLRSYFGAWMPRDNSAGELTQREVINFARFFVSELKLEHIPWSLNVLDDYYDTEISQWIEGRHDLAGADLNMSKVLENILDVMGHIA